MTKARSFLSITTASLLLAVPQTMAHPHVFADAELKVIINESGAIEALHHRWVFDDFFSSSVILDFDKNGNNVLDNDELKEVGKIVHGSLAEYNYFQFLASENGEITMKAPETIIAEMPDDYLILAFTTTLKEPMQLDNFLSIGVYDPTLYTAIDFAEDSDIQIQNLPENCSYTIIRPEADDIIALNQDTLTEDFYTDTMGGDFNRLVATRVEIKCQG